LISFGHATYFGIGAYTCALLMKKASVPFPLAFAAAAALGAVSALVIGFFCVRLLLLDEPSEGLAPLVVQQLGEQIRKLRQEGMTILLSEQNARFSLDLSDRLYILEKGKVRYQGTVDEFRKDEQAKTYLAI